MDTTPNIPQLGLDNMPVAAGEAADIKDQEVPVQKPGQQQPNPAPAPAPKTTDTDPPPAPKTTDPPSAKGGRGGGGGGKGKNKRGRGKGSKDLELDKQSENGKDRAGKSKKTASATPKPKTTAKARKPAAKRQKKDPKCTSAVECDPAPPPPPPSPNVPAIQSTKRIKQPPLRSGRQVAGTYTRNEVHAIQRWIIEKIALDWDTIANAVGDVTGKYRHAANLKTFYGTIILRQVVEAFPESVESGSGGGVGEAPVGVLVKEGENVGRGGTDENGAQTCEVCGAKRHKETSTSG